MKARSLVVACLALAVVARDERSIGGVPPSFAWRTPAAVERHRVTGVVHDDQGTPLTGAAVAVYPGDRHVLTDAAGRFDVTLTRPAGEIFVSTPGYEPTWRSVSSRTVDVVLHEIVRIAVGQSARVTINPTDSVGGADNEYLTRVIRVTCNDSVPAVGVVADDSGPVNYWIRAGTELEVELRMPWNAVTSRTFTVIASQVR